MPQAYSTGGSPSHLFRDQIARRLHPGSIGEREMDDGGLKSFSGTLSYVAERCPYRRAISVREGGELLYAHLNHSVEQLASRLLSLGIQLGDVVPIVFPDTVESVVSLLAVMRIRAVAAPLLDQVCTEEGFEHYLRKYNAKLLLNGPEPNPTARAVADRLDATHGVVSLHDLSHCIADVGAVARVINEPDDLALLLPTDGNVEQKVTQGRLASLVKSVHRQPSLVAADPLLHRLRRHRHFTSLFSWLADAVKSLSTAGGEVAESGGGDSGQTCLVGQVGRPAALFGGSRRPSPAAPALGKHVPVSVAGGEVAESGNVTKKFEYGMKMPELSLVFGATILISLLVNYLTVEQWSKIKTVALFLAYMGVISSLTGVAVNQKLHSCSRWLGVAGFILDMAAVAVLVLPAFGRSMGVLAGAATLVPVVALFWGGLPEQVTLGSLLRRAQEHEPRPSPTWYPPASSGRTKSTGDICELV